MARTAMTGVRFDPALAEAAAKRHGLTDASPSYLIRYALALMAGVPDVGTAATLRRPGRPRTREAARA